MFAETATIKREKSIKNASSGKEIIASHKQPKTNNIKKNNNNRILIIGVSIFGKTYLMKLFTLQKQELIHMITKSMNQYPNIKTQSLENYDNSTVVFDDMLLSKQAGKFDLFLQDGATAILLYTIYLQAFFTSQENNS